MPAADRQPPKSSHQATTIANDGSAPRSSPSRSQLTVHHVGEYAAVPWENVEAPIQPGSRADRVRDLNMSIASINLSDDLSDEFLARWRACPQPGKIFLPRLYFWDGHDRHKGPMRDVDVYWRRIDRFLAAMPLDRFQGIVLAEENIAWSGRPQVLTELYRRIKAKYDVPVWQWWTPGSAVPESGGWIPADGWVIDHYLEPHRPFRQAVRKYLATGLPLVIMPWASTAEQAAPITPVKWKANSKQLEVAIEFNVPVAFYWVDGAKAKATCHFGGNRDQVLNERDRVNQWVWKYIARVSSLPADYGGSPSADLADARVIELGPSRDGRLDYRDDFSTQKCIDDAAMTGFRDLRMDGKTLSARGFHGRPLATTLLYHFAGDYLAQNPTISLNVLANSADSVGGAGAAGGRVEIALSTDGCDWSHRDATTAAAPRLLFLSTQGDPRFADLRELWARITLTGLPGDRASSPLRVDDLRIDAAVAIPTDTTVTLKPMLGASDRFVYQDDFRTEKYLFTTQRSGDDQIEWSDGKIGVRVRPGGSNAELTWHFRTPSAVRYLAVELKGRANNGRLGTNHFLDISRDGKEWFDEASTVGRSANRSGWAAHGLRIELDDDPRFRDVTEFYVRLRMKARSQEHVHRALSGVVSRLRVSTGSAPPVARRR